MRPADWTALDLDRDPVPGDPTQVETSGRHYREVAAAIETAATRLRELAAHEQMQSEAVSALRERAEQVAADIVRAQERYEGVGNALVAYVLPLETAQADSARALADAQDALARLGPARSRAQRARDAVDGAPEGTDTSELDGQLRTADAAVAEAEADLAAARRACAQAVADRDAAAATAIRAVQDVEDTGDLGDSWWDDWGAKVVSVIAEVAGVVAMVAGLLALVVGWIPIIGQALAAVLGTIALVATAISLVCNLALALTGKGSWTKVVLDVISLATFGVGRAVATGARASYAATRGASRLAAGRIAARSPAVRAAAGLPTSSSATRTMRTLVGDGVAAIPRGTARNLAQAGRTTPAVSWTAPFRAARDEVLAVPGHLQSIAGAPWSQVVADIPDALRGIGRSRSGTELLARVYPNPDALADVTVRAGLDPAVAVADEVATHVGRAAVLTGVGAGAQVVSTGVDTYQAVDVGISAGDRSPVEGLQLPTDPGAGVGGR